MVDFANSNLCGASPEMNDLFKKLDEAAADIESKIDELASIAASSFADAQTELNTLTANLQSVEIPQLPKLSLQAEIKGLSELTPGTPAYTSSLANITEEFEADLAAAGKDLDTLINDGLSAINSGGNICIAVPNIEKEAGTDNPATEKAINVLQAAVPPLTEIVSKVTQNEDVTALVDQVEEDFEDFQESLATELEPLEEDSGAYKITDKKQVKEITTQAGNTKVVVKAVEKLGERKNVTPKSQSDGFVHRISSNTFHAKKSDVLFSSREADSDGFYTIQVELPHIPISRPFITQYNLADNEVRTVEDSQGTAYKETYGIHGEKLYKHPNLEKITNNGITIEGKVITFKTPYYPLGDHEGNLASISYDTMGPNNSPVIKVAVSEKSRGGRLGGRLVTDKSLNKQFKGRLFTFLYTYRDNYDPEVMV